MSGMIAAVGASTIYGAVKGGQQAKAAKKAKAAAKAIEAQQKALLEKQKNLKDKQNELVYASGVSDISTGSTTAIETATTQGQQVELKTGFETGPAQEMTTASTSEIINKAQSSLQKLVDTREMTSTSNILDFKSGETGIEKETASMLSSIDPGGAGAGMLEGFMGSIGSLTSLKG